MKSEIWIEKVSSFKNYKIGGFYQKKKSRGENNADKFDKFFLPRLNLFCFISQLYQGNKISKIPFANSIKIFRQRKNEGNQKEQTGKAFFLSPPDICQQNQLIKLYSLLIMLKDDYIHHLKLEENGVEINLKRSFALRR